MLKLCDARFPRDRAEVSRLFRQYAESLSFDLCFQDFDRELATLPGDYAAPAGCVLLAHVGQTPAGCVALRPLAANKAMCEMKRLYVMPDHRGRGAGRLLVQAVVARAVDMGYKSMRLDTIADMHAAIALYKALGFREIAPYRHNPVPDAVYMERRL